MMNVLPVSARRLARRAIQTGTERTPEGRLFPLFDRQGRVARVLLLRPAFGQMYLVRWHPGLFHVPCCGATQLAGEWNSLARITAENIGTVESLWHFDPWWVLAEDRYAVHWAAPLLKATNCADRLSRNVKMVYFRRDLSRLSWARIEEKGSMALIRWKEELLAGLPTATRPARLDRPESGWRLEPVWERRTGR